MAATDELGGFQFLEVRSTLPDELLMYTDKMSMAHGLEVRVPFLDRDVVEFVERLPAKLKVRWGAGKWLHRHVCKQYLPPRVTRRRKRGFAVNVVDGWLQKSLSAGMEDIFRFAGSRMYQLLNRDAVLGLLAEHRSRRHDHHKLLFSLIVLEHWLREHDGTVAEGAPEPYGAILRQVG
jgi:asparagine synthase (glutamine-hydrolysing)